MERLHTDPRTFDIAIPKKAKGQSENQPKCMIRKWWPRAESNHRHTDFQYEPPSQLWFLSRRCCTVFLRGNPLRLANRTPAEPEFGKRRRSGGQPQRKHPVTPIFDRTRTEHRYRGWRRESVAGLAVETAPRGAQRWPRGTRPEASDGGSHRPPRNCPRGDS